MLDPGGGPGTPTLFEYVGVGSGTVIGTTKASFAETFDGLIDEVSVYNRALSASEIQAIFQAGSAGKCKCQEVLKVGKTRILQLQGNSSAFFYEAGMDIDADGAPNAYHPPPHTKLGLDALSNAGHPGHWFALVTDNGKPNGNPIIQGPNDPYPGFYISTTSLQDTTKARTNPLRYVDSRQIPYMVLPPQVITELGADFGDFAVVINRDTDVYSPAIFADQGPRKKIGEGSIALADALGIPSNPRTGGTNSGVIYVVFPGSGNGRPRNINEITTEANSLFDAFGGIDQIDVCFPHK